MMHFSFFALEDFDDLLRFKSSVVLWGGTGCFWETTAGAGAVTSIVSVERVNEAFVGSISFDNGSDESVGVGLSGDTAIASSAISSNLA